MKEFFPLFKSFLEESIIKEDVKIFMDIGEIEGGQAWEMKIKDALIHSRIMVSVLSPTYFFSEWCRKEFAVMDYRQRQCDYLSINNPNGLIVPLKIHDGEHFSDYVKSIQIADFNDYYLVGKGFQKTILYVEFQRKLKKWIEEVVLAYNHAPSWDVSWKHPDWINKAWEDLDKLNNLKTKNQPVL